MPTKNNESKGFFKRAISFLKARYAPRGSRITFSPCAEDLMMLDTLWEFGVKKPVYIDIGAHHPIFGNNTYLFYRKGGEGVLVEPNHVLCEEINKKRPRDICLNGGVGKEDGEETFYLFERSTRSTFSEQQAHEWEKNSGQKPTLQKHKIFSLDTINNYYFNNKDIDVVSIDAEGYDVEIITGFSFKKRPKLFCIESVIFGKEIPEPHDKEIHNLMISNNYIFLAQTKNNSIYIDENLLRKKTS